MALQKFILLSFLAVVAIEAKFPPGFKFGAASSSYQIEGAWNVSGRGESNWDRMLHFNPAHVNVGGNADIAADSYHLWQEDINIAENLGLDFYRFSISWTRILPTGFPDKINDDGVRYYNNLIDGLLERGIQPVVTIYHCEIPQKLTDFGGWVNPLMVEWYADYARVLFELFADRVKTWITINEPIIICDFTYYLGTFPPNVVDPYIAPFVCSKNVLLAHAKAWRIYDQEYRPKCNGRLAMANCPMWIEPATPEDQELAETANEFGLGRFAHPIYSEAGGWPPVIEEMMATYSKKLRYPYSTLPNFTKDEIEYIKGTYDFLSLNYYGSLVVRPARADEQPGVWFLTGSAEMNAILYNDPSWEVTSFYNFPVVPYGLRRMIAWINSHYGNVSIFISENGYPSVEDDLHDESRMRFIRSHLEQVMLSLEDGAHIEAYTVWSLMDSFEWLSKYSVKFGIHHVDFSDPLRPRTPRLSAHYYRHVTRHRSLDSPPFVYEMKQSRGAELCATCVFTLSLLVLTCLVKQFS